jgi:Na+-transporting methylmalonyl-CoA/oxaloacetate decarboxylase gamma subunit
MMLILSINWSDAFTVTGLGLLIVFIVLTLLIFLLTLSGMYFIRKDKIVPAVQPVAVEQPDADAFSESEQAAVAMALHLFYNVHDEESYVITIGEHYEYSDWSSKIQAAHEF